MKIAVYTIALNEEKFVKRWWESAKDADYLLIADTGSSDNTVEVAEELGIKVISLNVKPWRFDDARNASLAFIPADIDLCIALDMDEVLVEGWRDHLEKLPPGTTRPRYKYIWSWQEDGSEGLSYGGDKIHSRTGYRWKHPVHETLIAVTPETQTWCGLQIHHHPDSSKSRGQYYTLLEVAKNESPNDDRTAFYYARELFFHGRLEEAAIEFQRHLSLPSAVWKPERAASMRYIAKCGVESDKWFSLATIESPDRREPWVDLAQYAHDHKDWQRCIYAVEKALSIKDRPLEYLCEDFAWGGLPYDLGSIAYWYGGNKGKAYEYCLMAKVLAPDNERIQENLKMMQDDLVE